MGGAFWWCEMVRDGGLEGAVAAGYASDWRGCGGLGEGVVGEFVAEGGFWDFICFWRGCAFLWWFCHGVKGGVVGGGVKE